MLLACRTRGVTPVRSSYRMVRMTHDCLHSLRISKPQQRAVEGAKPPTHLPEPSMNPIRLLPIALAATLAAACSTAPPATTYATNAPVVGVNATPATSATLSSGLNTQTTADRVVIGEPA